MSENWEFALATVFNGWVTILGDDDALLPCALKKVDSLIKRTKAKAIRSCGCSYVWPLQTPRVNYGWLRVCLLSGYKWVDSGSAIRQMLLGIRDYSTLPVLYNGGFISTDLIHQVKSITGNFYQSMNPDIYSGIVFSFLTTKYIFSFEPFAVNGVSHHSNGASSFFRGKHSNNQSPSDIFFSETNIPFHEKLPLSTNGRPVRSRSILVYEAFLKASSFHCLKSISTTHKYQLELALATADQHRDEVLEWAHSFINLYNIKPNPAIVAFLRAWNRIICFLQRLSLVLVTYRLHGSPQTPLSNVYEASLYAGGLVGRRPSLLSVILSYSARFLRSK